MNFSYRIRLLLLVSCLPLLAWSQWIGFNKSIDVAFAWETPARGANILGDELANLIQNAQGSVDACFYDVEFQPVLEAMIQAHDAGIAVRVITDDANVGNEAVLELLAAGIPVIDDAFGGLNSGGGEMHNKFCVIDHEIVWTGSYNLTIYGTYSNANNALWLEHTGLATAYTHEFNEMWGSSSLTPDPVNARFHGAKSDNTDHQFYQGGYSWRVYFSPSDGLTNQILQAISTADYEIYCSIFAFSTTAIADAIHAKMQTNPDFVVKGVFDQTYWNTSWSESIPMRGDGENGWDPPADVYPDNVQADLGLKHLHHKVMIIDGQHPGSNSQVITGSMNWSNNGENLNDENLLVIDDPGIVNQYVQEFAARLEEAGGSLDYIPQGLVIDPAVLDFQTVDYQTESTRSFSLKNWGATPLQITTGNFISPDGAFSVAEFFSGALAPGDSVVLTASFTPSFLGADMAEMPLFLDGGSDPGRLIVLRGRGISPEPVAIVINEFMPDPDAVFDNQGEWFELYNYGDKPVRLNQWRISDADADFQVLDFPAVFIFQPAGFIVLGNNADTLTNGGVVEDYQYYNFTLANTGDEIILRDDNGVLLDSVGYGSGWPLSAGRSTALLNPADDNALAQYWNLATAVYGAGDRGTPGASNENQVRVVSENPLRETWPAPPYPNPFNGSVLIPLAGNQTSEIKVYTLTGAEVWSAINQPGRHSVNWLPGNLAGGLYFVRLHSAAHWQTFKLIYLK